MNALDHDTLPRFIGVLHLLPLPGGPRPSPGLDACTTRAVEDARALVAGGAEAAILENFGDAPFTSERVDADTVAYMTRIALAVRDACPNLQLGINVLRNDARSALAIASAVGAAFIRVNVLVGAMVTDQGLITGEAREVLMERQRVGPHIRIWADVLVKHAVPLGPQDLVQVAKDSLYRGGADALIVTGDGTGQAIAPETIARLRSALPNSPLVAGSGVSPERVPMGIDAAIVGTYLHEDSDISRPVCAQRTQTMRHALDQAANSRS